MPHSVLIRLSELTDYVGGAVNHHGHNLWPSGGVADRVM